MLLIVLLLLLGLSSSLAFVSAFQNGQNASLVIGQPNFTSGSEGGNQSGFSSAVAASFDSSGNLWVADSNDNRILEFRAPFSNGENASAVIGEANFTDVMRSDS